VDKTTVYLTRELRLRLESLARRERRPQAVLIREALSEYLDGRGSSMPSFVGSVSIPGTDAATFKREAREQWYRDMLEEEERRARGSEPR